MTTPPVLSIVQGSSLGDYLAVGDVIDLQTLESDAPFFGMNVAVITADFLVLSPDLPRAARNHNRFPVLVPWHAIAWIRLGTSDSSFTDPAGDPPDSDDFGVPLETPDHY